MPALTRRAMLGTTSAAALAVRARADTAPIRIGVLTDMNGLFSAAIGPGSLHAARMAVADFGGIVLGRPIEVLSADNQNKADVGSSIAREWYDRDDVGMIVGLDNSAVALAVEQVAREHEKLVVAIAVATNDFTGKFCAPTALSWNYDSYAIATGVARGLVERGLDSWFFLSVDYAFGAALEGSAADAVRAAGGKVLGAVRHPIDAGDFSSFLIQAKASGAKVVALANGGGDTINALKQAREFGIIQGGQTVVPLLFNVSDIHSLGLPAAQGITFTTSFTWDRTEETRAWSRRFFEARKAMPTMNHAAVYSVVSHYLRGMAAAGTADSKAVLAKMKAALVHDVFTDSGTIRDDGRLVHDMFLVRVKAPDQSKYPWDYQEILARIPGDRAFRPLAEAGCPLTTGKP